MVSSATSASGPLAAPLDDFSPMAASGGKAAPQWTRIDCEILNVCFHQKRPLKRPGADFGVQCNFSQAALQ
jgi:hypothetical protein